jgi:thymidine kinase
MVAWAVAVILIGAGRGAAAQPAAPTTIAGSVAYSLSWAEMIEVIEVIGIDEAQFFEESLVSLANELVRLGRRVILAGLDTTFAGEPFAPIPNLLAVADEVTKLSAVCMQCGAPAVHTQRLGSNQALVLVGAAGVYEARCRACFRPWVDEHATEQLELPVGAGVQREEPSASRV